MFDREPQAGLQKIAEKITPSGPHTFICNHNLLVEIRSLPLLALRTFVRADLLWGTICDRTDICLQTCPQVATMLDPN